MEGPLAQTLVRLEPLGGEGVYLFGSQAQGTAGPRSDLDLLLVWPTPLAPLDRTGRILEALKDLPIPVKATVLTPEESEERKGLPMLARLFSSLGFQKEKPLELVLALRAQAQAVTRIYSIETPFGQKLVAGSKAPPVRSGSFKEKRPDWLPPIR